MSAERILPKLRLDELPRTFCIAKDAMPIIDPRPERPEMAAQYERSLPEFHLLKADLTGYAKVCVKNNSTTGKNCKYIQCIERKKMEHTKLISIIMAVHNAERTIGAAIESVLSQTYAFFELIIVDDDSTDSTFETASSYCDERITLIRNECRCGVSLTRKCALERAQGEWIAILDSDDKWAPDKLEKQIDIQKAKNADLVFTGSAFMDSEGKQLEWILHVPEEIHYRQLLKQNLISNSSVLVRREIYARNYAVGDKMHEDFATWLKMLRDGVTAYGIDEPLLIYRLSAGSKTSNKLKSAKMNWNTYRNVGLGLIESIYYMVFYTVNGLLKYRNLK